MPRSRVDRAATLLVTFGFALALGIATVAIPLVALASGYDPAAVGFLVAGAAAAQLATRLALPWLLGRFADRSLIGASLGLMLGAFVVLALSTSLVAFVVAQLAQGAARAIFWTAGQTHVIRDGGPRVRRLVDFNLAGNAGTLIGPTLGGLLAASSVSGAVIGAATAVALAVLVTPFVATYAAFDRRQSAGTAKLLRREGVDVAVWATFVSGAWWSMMGSYVPVIVVGAGLGSTQAGLLVSLSEGSGAVMMLVLRWLAPVRLQRIVHVAPLVQMAALAGFALVPAVLPAYAGLLIVGGSAAGAVTVLAPALVTHVANDQEHGDAIALTGTSRAVALLGTPAAVGGLLSLVSLPIAIVCVAAGVVAPGLVVGRSASRDV
jgi:MFS family permease